MNVAGAVEAPGYEWTTPAREDWLLRLPLPLPRIHTPPWWFLVQELRIPGVFSPETGLADLIFGPDRAIVLEMEWMIQALLTGGRSLYWELSRNHRLRMASTTSGEYAPEPGVEARGTPSPR